MREGMPMADTTDQSPTESGDVASVFLSKEVLGGKKCKPGDTLTLKVVDVDPESGDVQADLQSGGETTGASGDYASDFDNSMPEEGGMEA